MGEKTVKEMIFESAFGGRNKSVQLNVRISPELNEALDAESKRRGQQVSDLVRDGIAFLLIPDFLKGKLGEGIELDSKDRALLKAYMEHLLELEKACLAIDEAQEKVKLKEVERRLKKLKSESDWFERLVEKRLGKLVEQKVEEVISRRKGHNG
jgi:hypothetical protein